MIAFYSDFVLSEPNTSSMHATYDLFCIHPGFSADVMVAFLLMNIQHLLRSLKERATEEISDWMEMVMRLGWISYTHMTFLWL
jgi:hypothetical protein